MQQFQVDYFFNLDLVNLDHLLKIGKCDKHTIMKFNLDSPELFWFQRRIKYIKRGLLARGFCQTNLDLNHEKIGCVLFQN